MPVTTTTTAKLTTRALLARSLAVIALAAALLYSISAVNRWTGDWAALLWVCGTLFFPWVAGVAAGRRATIRVGKLLGAAIGALIVLVPLIAFATPDSPPPEDARTIAAVFTLIGAVNGAMSFPVGIRVRSEKTSHDA